jgi:8-oxo-dGTP pyrophosphatase MutT (NUDIX family)
MEQQYSAGGVVITQDDAGLWVLLIKDRFGHWTWPKGHIEQGETPKATALREITEETGAKDLTVLDQICIQEYDFTFQGKPAHKTIDIFLVGSSGKTELVAQVEELDLAEWFLEEEALQIVEYEGARDVVRKAIEMYRQLVVDSG